MSKTRLRELFIKGHISYEEYMAEIDRLDDAREKLYDLYITKKITLKELKYMLAQLDRDEGDLIEPPVIY